MVPAAGRESIVLTKKNAGDFRTTAQYEESSNQSDFKNSKDAHDSNYSKMGLHGRANNSDSNQIQENRHAVSDRKSFVPSKTPYPTPPKPVWTANPSQKCGDDNDFDDWNEDDDSNDYYDHAVYDNYQEPSYGYDEYSGYDHHRTESRVVTKAQEEGKPVSAVACKRNLNFEAPKNIVHNSAAGRIQRQSFPANLFDQESVSKNVIKKKIEHQNSPRSIRRPPKIKQSDLPLLPQEIQAAKELRNLEIADGKSVYSEKDKFYFSRSPREVEYKYVFYSIIYMLYYYQILLLKAVHDSRIQAK